MGKKCWPCPSVHPWGSAVLPGCFTKGACPPGSLAFQVLKERARCLLLAQPHRREPSSGRHSPCLRPSPGGGWLWCLHKTGGQRLALGCRPGVLVPRLLSGCGAGSANRLSILTPRPVCSWGGSIHSPFFPSSHCLNPIKDLGNARSRWIFWSRMVGIASLLHRRWLPREQGTSFVLYLANSFWLENMSPYQKP